MADSLRVYLSLAFTGVLWLIYTPLFICFFAWFYKHRNNQMIKKRHSIMTKNILICQMMIGTIFLPSYLLLYSDVIIDFESNRRYVFYPIYVCLAVSLWMFVWKQWLYYFDTHLAKMSLNNEWKQFLNPSAIANNWFIINKNRFKERSTLHWRFFISILTLFLATTLPEFVMDADVYVKEFVFLLFGSFWTLLAMIALAVIRYNTPELEDLFLIRRELLYIVLVLCTYSAVPIMHAINTFVFPGHRLQVVIFVLQQWYLSTVLLLCFYILSVWPILKNKHWINQPLLKHQPDHVMLANTSNIDSVHSSNSKQCASRLADMTLRQVLKNEAMFDSFMQHLIKEFSMEIMLALIELSQFQESMHAFALTIDENIMISNQEWKFACDLLTDLSYIPQSSIVFDALNEEEVNTYKHVEDVTKQKQMEFLIRSHKIYDKYFDSGSDFEINISFGQRNLVTEQLFLLDAWKVHDDADNEDALTQLNQLFQLFNPAIGSMFTLLQYSFSRFKTAANGIEPILNL
eukprot:1122157_1